MALTTVTVTWDENDIGQAPLGGNITFLLSEPVFDSADGIDVRPTPKTYFFASATGTGTSDPLVANDNASLQPSGSYYTVTVAITGQAPYVFATAINHANGASQTLSFLQANAAVPAATFAAYLPLPSGSPLAGQVPAVIANGSTATAWTTGGGTGGGVSSVSAADTSIVVGGTGSAPTIATGTLDVIATDHPPAAAWSNNHHQINSVANGTASSDAAAFGQIPASAGSIGGLLAASNLSDLASASTARTNLALGSAATQNSSAFDASGAAAAAQANAIAAIPAFDATATDIQPLGTQAAGSTGKTADAGHVHPLVSGFLPSDMGLMEWTGDPAFYTTTSSPVPTSGQPILIRVPMRVQRTITSINLHMPTLGSGLTAGNFAGLYTSGGTLIGTSADQTTAWNTGGSVGFLTIPLASGPFTVGAGFVWVAILFTGTTGPSFIRAASVSTSAANLGLGPSTARYAHLSGTAATSLPASFTPSSSTLSPTTFWAGLS